MEWNVTSMWHELAITMIIEVYVRVSECVCVYYKCGHGGHALVHTRPNIHSIHFVVEFVTVHEMRVQVFPFSFSLAPSSIFAQWRLESLCSIAISSPIPLVEKRDDDDDDNDVWLALAIDTHWINNRRDGRTHHRTKADDKTYNVNQWWKQVKEKQRLFWQRFIFKKI